MEKHLKKILNILELNDFLIDDLSFMAGDASDRKYFLAKIKKRIL